jgi:hypothetical protein
MKLEIDTEKDSRATLKGVLRMLQAILGEEGETYSNRSVESQKIRNIFDESSPSISMYDTYSDKESAPSTSGAASTPSTSASSGAGLFNMFGSKSAGGDITDAEETSNENEEEPEDEPRIEIY